MSPVAPRWLDTLRWAPVALGAVHIALFAIVVVGRSAHPVELEWMSGGVWDHIERVTSGRPIYAQPSAEFTAFLYPPLHYWLSALVAKVLPIPVAGRVVSVLATSAAAYCVYRATKRLAGDPLVALALFAGAYSVTGFWYDLDRSDSLCAALLAGAFVVALEAEGQRRMLFAGALLGLAFLAKQPAMVFLFAAVGALTLARRFRLAGALLGGGLAVLIPAVAYLQSTTQGWFWFYCMKMPASHGMSSSLVTLFFVHDAWKTFALFGASLVIAALVVRSRSREKSDVLLIAFVAAGFFTSASSRLHKGGWVNGLIFLTTFGAVAFGVLRARAAKQPRLSFALDVIAVLQLVRFLHDPRDAMPSGKHVATSFALRERITRLEDDGEVLVLAHSHVARQRHLHAMALVDVLRTTGALPTDLEVKLRERRFVAYVVDEPAGIGLDELVGQRTPLFALAARNYRVAEHVDDLSAPVVGYPARTTWILRPRETPLTDLDGPELEKLVRSEMNAASSSNE